MILVISCFTLFLISCSLFHPVSPVRVFIIIWLGQFASIIGSWMTSFAIEIWIWEQTNQVMPISLWNFCYLLLSILISPIAGVLVDRWNRKYLLIIGDSLTGLTTLVILCLYLTNSLQVWHLYLTGAIAGAAQQIHELSYAASITLVVPKHQYVRVSSLRALSRRTTQIIAPTIAGFFYFAFGLTAIAVIDLTTFAIAVTTLSLVSIPQPDRVPAPSRLASLTVGVRYIFARPNLAALIGISTLFWFVTDIGEALSSPMILARTNNDTRILGSIITAAGLGGVTGALFMGIWGGPQKRVQGILRSMMGAGISKIMFGLGQAPQVWIPAQFCSSLNFPILSSCDTAIWMTKVNPALQGQVFAMQSFMLQTVSAIAALIAGLLADQVFEPAMSSNGRLASILSPIFSTGSGAGMAVLYVITSISLLLVGCSGYAMQSLRNIEEMLPDHETVTK